MVNDKEREKAIDIDSKEKLKQTELKTSIHDCDAESLQNLGFEMILHQLTSSLINI